jgi:hypothetical protein
MSEFGKIETIKKFLNFTYFVVRKKRFQALYVRLIVERTL